MAGPRSPLLSPVGDRRHSVASSQVPIRDPSEDPPLHPSKREDTLSRITSPNGRYEHWIEAYINDIKVVAFPDNCSTLNIISEDFANRNKLLIDRTKRTSLRLPNKEIIQSSGYLQLRFRFDGEATIFNLVFTVLPSCVCNIVLSSEFLQSTKTFTTFKSRIQRWFNPCIRPRPRVCLQGYPEQQVVGSINGHPVAASPDTGSDVNVISKDYTESIGLVIDTNPNVMETLEFIDGSSMTTCGIVYDVKWKFGEVSHPPAPQMPKAHQTRLENVKDWEYGSDARSSSTFICSFYVLENLSCPVLLSADLLYGTNAFVACTEHFQRSTSNPRKRKLEEADMCVIKKKRKTVGDWAGKFFSKNKANSGVTNNPPVVSDLVVEARRRLQELDRIDDLPVHQQAVAQEAERMQKQKWTQNKMAQSNPMTFQQPVPQPNPPNPIPIVNAQSNNAANATTSN